MARLPSQYDLSGPASLRSGRAIASVDTSGLTRGIQSLGGAIADIGADVRQQDNTLDVARAEAYKTKGLIDTTNQFSQDGDYSTFGQRAPQETQKVVDGAANLIRDPAIREKWKLSAGTDAVRTNDAINDKARALGKQANTVAFDDALEVNRRIYVDPETSDEQKAKAKADIEGAISMGEQSGLITPTEGAARRDQFVRGAQFTRAKLAVERDPNAVTTPLPRNVADRSGRAMGVLQSLGWTKEQAAGVVGNLVAESSLNTNALNPGDGSDGSDSIGVAQWNGSRAKALKDFAASKGTDWKDFDTQIAFIDHELRNSPSERAAFEALQKASDPKAAAEAMIQYERPRGSDKGVQNAHNYQGRVRASLQAAGMEVNPEWFKDLAPEEKQVVYNQAETRRRQISQELQGGIENVVQNAPTAIQNTGAYDGQIPTRDDFTAAYGPQDGNERYNKFSAALDVSQQSYGFRTMSADEIQQVVKEAAPVSSGDGAALETAKYDTLSRAAASTLAARKADPATYAMQAFPAVQSAMQQAKESGDYQTAMTAMATAQRQLGVRDMQLLPKEVATESVATFKDDATPGTDRLNAVAGLVFSTSDPDQRAVVYKQLVDAGLPQTMEGVFEAMARGDQGAATRLMEAVTADPAKLPVNKETTPATITEGIYSNVWAPGSIGFTSYGMAYGDASSLERAQRGTDLMNKSVRIRMSRGEDMQTAIDGAKKDLFGDKVVFTGDSSNGVTADLAIPPDMDQDLLGRGLAASKEVFKQALMAQRDKVLNGQGAPAAGGQRAIVETATENRVNDILSNGVFVSTGNGVGLRDPYTGSFVAGSDGKPLTFPINNVLEVGKAVSGVTTEEPQAPGEPLTINITKGAGEMTPQTQQEADQQNYGRFSDLLPGMGQP